MLHARTPRDAFPDRAGRIYSIHIPAPGPQSTFEWSVTYSSTDVGLLHAVPASVFPVSTRLGDWEVTVAVDLARCEIYCAYRRIPDALGRTRLTGLLLPPITAIRFYTDSASNPTTLIVDPAGLRYPAATSTVPVSQEKLYIPGRRAFAIVLVAEGDDRAPASLRAHSFSSTNNPETTARPALPLRI
ncbi:MAG: hypothetical protein LAQ69_02280 [Acidobacteriia bacterium]|nr:hypothetical protein [Terriglobia bacterium]